MLPKKKRINMSISAVDVDKTIEKVESYKDKSLRLPKPSGYKILVALPNIEERTEGGIIKPDSVIEKESTAANIGFVMALGPDAYVDKDKFPSGAWCKEGDFVVMRTYSGTRMFVDGEEFRMLNDDSIEGVVADPRGFSRAN
jgi:co-chaperonin GroES (HSP10)